MNFKDIIIWNAPLKVDINKKEGLQKYVCSHCKHTCCATTNTVVYHSKLSFDIWKNVIDNLKTIGIFVGPEGGIEEYEIERLKDKGAHIVTLGKRILRTETAGFVATSLIQYELSDLGGND